MTLKPLLMTSLKLLVSGVVMALLISRLQSGLAFDALSRISPWTMLALLMSYLALQGLCALKWHVMARNMGIGGSYIQYLGYYLAGMFFGLFLPTGIGGDVGRAVLQSRSHGSSWTHAMMSIMADRFTGLCGLLTFLVIGLIVVKPLALASWMSGVLIPVLLGVYAVVLFAARLQQWAPAQGLIRRFILKYKDEGIASAWPAPNAVLMGIALSVLYHALIIMLHLGILSQLGLHPGFYLVAIVYALSSLASLIPISLSGIGIREGTLAFLLAYLGGFSENMTSLYSLLWLSILLMATVPGALLVLTRPVFRPVRKSS